MFKKVLKTSLQTFFTLNYQATTTTSNNFILVTSLSAQNPFITKFKKFMYFCFSNFGQRYYLWDLCRMSVDFKTSKSLEVTNCRFSVIAVLKSKNF